MVDSADKEENTVPPKISFEHKFFGSVKDPVFRLSEQTEEPCMFFKFGDSEVALPLPGIKTEFDLHETADVAMLDLVEESLKFVISLEI